MAKDYYSALGVDKNATADEIKKAYRKMAIKYHPDKNPGDKKAEDQFKVITEAYTVLSDPEKKLQYDSYGDSAFHQRFSQEDIFRGSNINDIFREFGLGGNEDILSQLFGGGGRRGQQPFGGPARPREGADYNLKVRVPFRIAVTGGERRISFRTERGSEEMNVKIPAGTETGQRLRISEKGGLSPDGGRAGDLFLDIQVDSDPNFWREENDLFTKVKIPYSGLCLGTSVDVPTLDTKKRVKVKAGTRNGSKIRLKGFGVQGNPKGDLYAVVETEVPTELTDVQRQILEQLKKEGL
jgi:curved DNA-binding protein